MGATCDQCKMNIPGINARILHWLWDSSFCDSAYVAGCAFVFVLIERTVTRRFFPPKMRSRAERADRQRRHAIETAHMWF